MPSRKGKHLIVAVLAMAWALLLGLGLATSSQASVLYSEDFTNSPTGWARIEGFGTNTFTAYAGEGVLDNTSGYFTVRYTGGSAWTDTVTRWTYIYTGVSEGRFDVRFRCSASGAQNIDLYVGLSSGATNWSWGVNSTISTGSKSHATANGSEIKVEIFDIGGNTGTVFKVYDDDVQFIDYVFPYDATRANGSLAFHRENSSTVVYIDDLSVSDYPESTPTFTPTPTNSPTPTASPTATPTVTPIPTVSAAGRRGFRDFKQFKIFKYVGGE